MIRIAIWTTIRIQRLAHWHDVIAVDPWRERNIAVDAQKPARAFVRNLIPKAIVVIVVEIPKANRQPLPLQNFTDLRETEFGQREANFSLCSRKGRIRLTFDVRVL